MSALLLATSACGVLTHRERTAETPAPEPVAASAVAEPAAPEVDSTAAAAQDIESASQENTPAAPGPEERLVHYANAWLSLSREAQRQEFLETEARYLKNGATSDLMHYAMLSVLRAPERANTTKRVRGDLRRYLENGTGTEAPVETGVDVTHDEFMPMAKVLLYLLEEREQTLGQLTAQNETLQRQLDELKAIEEQLRDRTGSEPIQATPR